MMWNIRHLCPSGARYMFNMYKHWNLILVRSDIGETLSVESKEGVTQGDPMDMIGYSIGILPLIRHLTYILPNLVCR